MNTPAMPMSDTLPWYNMLNGAAYGGMIGAGLGGYYAEDRKDRMRRALLAGLAGAAAGYYGNDIIRGYAGY